MNIQGTELRIIVSEDTDDKYGFAISFFRDGIPMRRNEVSVDIKMAFLQVLQDLSDMLISDATNDIIDD